MVPPVTDLDLEEVFGPPTVAAADLIELAVFAGGVTPLPHTSNNTRLARQACLDIDPTWRERALSIEKVVWSSGRAPDPLYRYIEQSDPTWETILSCASGGVPPTRTIGAREYPALWPAQQCSPLTWASLCADALRVCPSPPTVGWYVARYVHPSVLFLAARTADTPYGAAVAAVLADGGLWLGLPLRAAVLPASPHLGQLAGSSGAVLPVLAAPNGEMSMYYRSLVLNGFYTSHSLAYALGLDTARTSIHAWI